MSMTHPQVPRSFVPALPFNDWIETAQIRGRRGLRRLADLRDACSVGAELVWFASAVIVGLALAGWLAGLFSGDAAPLVPAIQIL
jgi:hypothetical protein